MLSRKGETLTRRAMRPTALLLSVALLAPTLLSGCGNGGPPPARDATSGEMSRMNPSGAPTRAGMSTKKKLVLLAGAALLYYMYKKNQAAKSAPQGVQYYLSKNGRVYYRDPKTKQAIWVTPPPNQVQPMQVPEADANEYRDFAGYNNQTSGRQLSDVFEVR